MNVVRERLGDLECVTYLGDRQQPARQLVVLCHGFGAPGDDLVGLAGEWLNVPSIDWRHTEFIFPAAPLELGWEYGFEARAWWPINMAQLQAMALRGDLTDMEQYVPPELAECREKLQSLVAARLRHHGLDPSAWFVGGFSQGAMLAVDVALHAEQGPGGLIIWSGALLAADVWRQASRGRSKLTVVQSHGTYDMVLPFQAGERLRDFLVGVGHSVEFLPFDGPHTVSGEAIQAAARLVGR